MSNLYRHLSIFNLVFESPAFLAEVHVPEEWSEHCVQVDGQQLVVVSLVWGAEGVDCVVGSSHGVHETGQRAVQHLEKRVSHRISRKEKIILVFKFKFSST